MKTIKYSGEVIPWTTTTSSVYMITCVDFNPKKQKFIYVMHNEMYETYKDALNQIIKNVKNLKPTVCVGLALKELNNNKYKTSYKIIDKDGEEVWIERKYCIQSFSWNNENLEEMMKSYK